MTHEHTPGPAHDHDHAHDHSRSASDRQRQHQGHAHGHAPSHGHSHGHAHGHHGHDHGPLNFGRAFLVAIVLNSAFVVIEFGYGFIAHSTALMADAGHNLSDVLSLGLAWGAALLARRTPAGRFTYGLRSTSILAALANALLLLLACGAIAWEALRRVADPPAVDSPLVMIVAGVGIVINGLSAWLFVKGSDGDLNIRGAYLHMLADAAVSLGVVLAAALILYTGWYWVDPLLSLVIVLVIVVGTWGLLRDAVHLALDGVPAQVDADAVTRYLGQLDGVSQVHDLHIWGMSTTENALTVHLVMPAGHPGDAFMAQLASELRERFSVHHSTVQIAQSQPQPCVLHEAAAQH